ncbi:DUF6452 family protein [Flavobacterium sp. LS1R49]|uniref:DUF6452 family protein n=1 Tax=Flavobacterium shii TaxID=2987687 RepID=A0A9X3BXR3_9FLAO|nr:DUF6452 family protein [Flavobacterium shii]MCV9926891.1 DUF6452 family protein [Flavobacterium shii]
MKKILFIIIAVAFTFSGCEKDDICDANTPTTPRLVISFFDISNPSVPKNVRNLKVIGEGMTEGIVFNENAIDELKYITNGNTISIPLKTDATSTTYKFILNYNDPNTALINEDRLRFNYTHQNIFVSRACGFKTTFNLTPLAPFVLTDSDNQEGFWMQFIEVEDTNIELENETHVKIYF